MAVFASTADKAVAEAASTADEVSTADDAVATLVSTADKAVAEAASTADEASTADKAMAAHRLKMGDSSAGAKMCYVVLPVRSNRQRAGKLRTAVGPPACTHLQ